MVAPARADSLGLPAVVVPERSAMVTRSSSTGPRCRLGATVVSNPALPANANPPRLDQDTPRPTGTVTVPPPSMRARNPSSSPAASTTARSRTATTAPTDSTPWSRSIASARSAPPSSTRLRPGRPSSSVRACGWAGVAAS